MLLVQSNRYFSIGIDYQGCTSSTKSCAKNLEFVIMERQRQPSQPLHKTATIIVMANPANWNNHLQNKKILYLQGEISSAPTKYKFMNNTAWEYVTWQKVSL